MAERLRWQCPLCGMINWWHGKRPDEPPGLSIFRFRARKGKGVGAGFVMEPLSSDAPPALMEQAHQIAEFVARRLIALMAIWKDAEQR